MQLPFVALRQSPLYATLGARLLRIDTRSSTRSLIACAFLLFSPLSVIDGQVSSGTPDPSPTVTLRFDVNLVQIDAVVTDKQGNRISDLTRDDFEVLQDGHPQTVTHLSYVRGSRPPVNGNPRANGQLDASEVARTIVVFLDDVGMDFSELSRARSALLKFVASEVRPGDLWGIHTASGGSDFWQKFSSNPDEIRAMVEHLRWRLLSADSQPVFFPEFTISIVEVLHALQKIPGRKTMIFVNHGSYYNVASVNGIADLANRASVKIQSIDARGLQVSEAMRVSYSDASQRFPSDPSTGMTPSVDSGPLSRSQLYFLAQQAAASLAEKTGGVSFTNRNSLLTDLQSAVNDDDGYYLIAWNPGDVFAARERGGYYHEIKVKLRRPGLRIRSRAGFFSVPGGDLYADDSTKTKMQHALFSPFRMSGIEVAINAAFDMDGKSDIHIDSQVHVAPAGIQFAETSKGCYVARLELLTTTQVMTVDSKDAGRSHSQMTTIEACGSAAEAVRRNGIVYLTRTKVQKPGPYQVRVAIRNFDSESNSASIGPKTLTQRSAQTSSQPNIGSAM